MALAKHALCSLAHGRKGFGQNVVQRLAFCQPCLQKLRLVLQLLVAHRLELRFQRIDLRDQGPHRFDVAIVGRSENRSEEHTSELQSLMRISYAVFCLKKKKNKKPNR